jgi:putative heme-binding domain-containing protein
MAFAKSFGYIPKATTITLGPNHAVKEGLLKYTGVDARLNYPKSPEGHAFKIIRAEGLQANANYRLEINGEFVAEGKGSEWSKGLSISDPQTEKLRRELIEKNELFFHHWRPQNTTYLFFFRKHEQGQNAKEVDEIRTYVTKRDQKIHELIKPQPQSYQLIKTEIKHVAVKEKTSLVPDDAGPNFVLNPEKEIKTFILPEDLEVNLFASEPMIVNPTNMNWDQQGRLWVCSTPTYPQVKPGQLANDKIIVLEDTDGDGKADKDTVFAEGLLIPAAVLPYKNGAFVANSTELIYFEDTDGDLVADKKRIVFSGFGTEDTHHTLHTPRWGQDGMLYINQSIYIHSHVETPHGVSRLMAGGIWRYNIREEKFEVFTRGLVNTWGHQMDQYGQSFATDGAGGHGINYVFPDFAGLTAYGTKHILKGMNPGQPKHCGLEILTGTHFPEKYRGILMGNDFRGHRTNAFRLSDSGSGYHSKQVADMISTGSKKIDRKGEGGGFRPIDIKMGPDGAVYLADWSNIIIQHGEVDFRDERRDRQNGRIWRITAKGRPLVKQPTIAGASLASLLKNLSSPERWTVDMSKREIMERPRSEILPALKKFARTTEQDYLKLQALWMQQSLNECDRELLESLLNSKEGKIRAAALRVLKDFHATLPETEAWLSKAVRDEYPRVRLEALHVLRERKSLKSAELAMEVLERGMDKVLDYVLVLTMKELEPHWVGKTTFGDHIDRINYAVKSTGSKKALSALIEAQQTGAIPPELQVPVLKTVAELGGAKEAAILFNTILSHKINSAGKVVLINAMSEAAQLRKVKPKADLSKLRALFQTNDPALLKALCTLVGSYKVAALQGEINRLIESSTVDVQLVAIKSLGLLNSPASIKYLISLVDKNVALPLKEQAIIEVAPKNIQKACALAIKYFKALPEQVDGEKLFQSLIRQKNGGVSLEKALQKQALPQHVALAGVRQVNISGLQLQSLIASLNQAGDLKPMKQVLSSDEMKAMVTEVQSKGNPHIGESIYRRQSLACINCHAIGGVGPEIGPDLISIGASAPVDYLIESLLQPSKKIKEGYHMTMLTGKDGSMLSGSEVSSNDKSITLRDTSGVLTTWPMSKVKQKQVVPMSMMPPGLTASLNREEFVHLISFLSNLGKEGDFKFSSNDYVRTVDWVEVDQKLAKAFTSRGITGFWEKPDTFNWQKGYSKVSGSLPVDKSSQNYRIMRFECDIVEAGKIALEISHAQGVTVKTEQKVIQSFSDGVTYADMNKGKHYFYIGVDAKKANSQFRIEVKEIEGLAGRFQLKK